MIAILQRTKLLTYVLVLALVSPVIGQQSDSAPAFTREQLEQIAAPVALYPDPLLAQVLMASTYPLEVVQAARFLRDHKDLKGPQLDEALKEQTWDDSVKSLISFPEVLSLMDGKLDWTQQLGDATIGQQKELMEAIQRLRARAQAEGNLKSSKEQTVTVEPAPPAAAPGQAAPAQQRSSSSRPIPTSSTCRPTIPPSSTGRGRTPRIPPRTHTRPATRSVARSSPSASAWRWAGRSGATVTGGAATSTSMSTATRTSRKT